MSTGRSGGGMALPQIDPDRCTGCGRCVAVCPPHVLSLHALDLHKKAALDHAPDCTGCALCYVHCPFDAIRMLRKTTPCQSPESKS